LDVAKRAGVGRRTVSNVVTGFPYVSQGVRERVLRAIDELGYVPNRAAQQLRTGRSGVIALTVPDVGVGYFGELGNLVVEEAAALGLGTVVAQTRGSRDGELAEIERILALQPDGLIMSPLELSQRDLESITARTSVALIGEHFVDGPVRPIAIDNVIAASEVVAHLIASGREHIAFLGMLGASPRFNELRRRGYADALSSAGLQPATGVEVADFTTADGFDSGVAVAARIAGGERIDAIFCVTDEVAIGVVRGLHDAGIRVPDDVAVAGFDDIVEGRYSTPRLTTIAPDKREIARRAVAMVLGEEVDPAGIEYRLELRESTTGVVDGGLDGHQRR